jgi:hypothetical protein
MGLDNMSWIIYDSTDNIVRKIAYTKKSAKDWIKSQHWIKNNATAHWHVPKSSISIMKEDQYIVWKILRGSNE